MPISINLILNPFSALKEPGLTVESAGQLSVLLFNLGGLGSPPLFLLAPFVLYLIVAVISKEQRKVGITSLLVISIAATLSSYFIEGNSSSAQRIWSGPLVIFAQLLTLLSFFAITETLIPQLKRSNFGIKHIGLAASAVITVISIISISIWTATTGANSLLRSNQEQVIPAFISDLASTTERPKTLAERRYADDVPEEVKGRRLNEIIEKQLAHSLASNQRMVGTIQKVLIEGNSKRSEEHLCGRTGSNAMVVFPKENQEKGNYVHVRISSCTSATLMGEIVAQP